jgi:hypothetical protein
MIYVIRHKLMIYDVHPHQINLTYTPNTYMLISNLTNSHTSICSYAGGVTVTIPPIPLIHKTVYVARVPGSPNILVPGSPIFLSLSLSQPPLMCWLYRYRYRGCIKYVLGLICIYNMYKCIYVLGLIHKYGIEEVGLIQKYMNVLVCVY